MSFDVGEVRNREHHIFAGFIEWAKSQIEMFAEMFRIQVFSTGVDQSVIDEALSITYSQSRKVRTLTL